MFSMTFINVTNILTRAIQPKSCSPSFSSGMSLLSTENFMGTILLKHSPPEKYSLVFIISSTKI